MAFSFARTSPTRPPAEAFFHVVFTTSLAPFQNRPRFGPFRMQAELRETRGTTAGVGNASWCVPPPPKDLHTPPARTRDGQGQPDSLPHCALFPHPFRTALSLHSPCHCTHLPWLRARAWVPGSMPEQSDCVAAPTHLPRTHAAFCTRLPCSLLLTGVSVACLPVPDRCRRALGDDAAQDGRPAERVQAGAQDGRPDARRA